MNQKISYRPILILFTIFSIISSVAKSQNNSIAFAAADSSKFSPNLKDGWQLFNSYVSTYKKDSATLELIIQHTNNINWTKEQFIGKIKYPALLPKAEQVAFFTLISNKYRIRIETTGRCYLNFIAGAIPTGEPVILPLTIFYKL
jgi:hypothetical protein